MSHPSVWIVNPYGSLPSETWTTYRSTMLAEALERHGYAVTQFISNFEHRSKTFRTPGFAVEAVSARYTVRIIPGTGYRAHISLHRIRHERAFAKNLLKAVQGTPAPDFLILAEPAIFYYDILLEPLVLAGGSVLVLDVIDLWPELFELAIPQALRPLSGVLLAPFFAWRKRLYRYPKAIVGVAADYVRRARELTARPDVLFEVVYWGYPGDRHVETGAASESVRQTVASKTSGDIWIVYAGTLGENYDIRSIVGAAARFAAETIRGRRVTFLIAGDGPLKELCEASASPNLRFLGRLPAADLPALYRRCDVALSTYKGESTVAMPIKTFDYLRWGLPIVNSLGRDIGELVERDRIGLNYEPGSSSSLYQAIRRLAEDDELRVSCAANARALAKEFEADVQYVKFARLLDRLAQATRSTQ